MIDQVRVVRLTGERGPVDPETLAQSRIAALVYTGAARVRPEMNAQGDQMIAGEGKRILPLVMVSVPMGTPVRPDDLVQVLASADTLLIGAWLRVQPVDAGTHVTARRLHCQVTDLYPPVVVYEGSDSGLVLGGGGV